MTCRRRAREGCAGFGPALRAGSRSSMPRIVWWVDRGAHNVRAAGMVWHIPSRLDTPHAVDGRPSIAVEHRARWFWASMSPASEAPQPREDPVPPSRIAPSVSLNSTVSLHSAYPTMATVLATEFMASYSTTRHDRSRHVAFSVLDDVKRGLPRCSSSMLRRSMLGVWVGDAAVGKLFTACLCWGLGHVVIDHGHRFRSR
jgi:hypothetical protein